MERKLDMIADWPERMKLADYKVSALARLCGVSERHFEREIRRRFHLAPREWIRRVRLNRAARWLLARGRDFPIKAIALEAGFKEPEHFYRQFKGSYGETPASFRRAEASLGQADRQRKGASKLKLNRPRSSVSAGTLRARAGRSYVTFDPAI